MAGRRGSRRGASSPKRQKSVAETSRNNNRKSTRLVDIPIDVLESILSPLSLKDNIRVVCVCKRLLAAVVSVRKAEKPPWLMRFPLSNSMYEFYDPLTRKSYYLELPQLKDVELHYAKCEWLLLVNPKTQLVCLFNPYSKELMEFSKLEVDVTSSLAFSAPPTSPNCIVFSVHAVGDWLYRHVVISTCRPGETKWTAVNYITSASFLRAVSNKVIFSNGCFYCISYNGSFGIYNHEEQTWRVLRYILPGSRDIRAPLWANWRLIAECNGNIYAILLQWDTVITHKFNVDNETFAHKFNVDNETFEKIEDLGGASLFANLISPYIRTDLLGKLRDKIYMPKIEYFSQRCHAATHTVSKRSDIFPAGMGFIQKNWYSMKTCGLMPQRTFQFFFEIYELKISIAVGARNL